MANALTLATATTHGGGIPAPLTILLVVAAVGYVLWSRMQGRPLKLRRLIVLPAVLVVLGIADLTGSSAPHLTPEDIGFLAAGVALSAVLGAARGATIEIYPNQGELWQRYRPSTVGLWVALIAAKLVLLAVASSARASAGGGTNSLLLCLGVSLLAEAAVVGPRAMSTGLPFATGRTRRSGDRPGSGRTSPGPIHRFLDEAPAHSPTASDPASGVDPYGEAVLPPSPARVEPRRDAPAPWGPPQQVSDGYRSDRRHSHRGPIHRLLGADGSRRRVSADWTDEDTRPPAPTRSAPGQDSHDHADTQDDRDGAGQWRSPSLHDGAGWLREQIGQPERRDR